MKFPNKVNLYHDTVIYSMSIVFDALDHPAKVIDLYTKVKSKMQDGILSFQDALACLYAMGRIGINDKEEIFRC